METVASNPLITVIIPVYNTEPYLRQCLDSVCGQTYGNLEIICVNDGSTDGSQAILEEYAARDARVKVLVQENAGQAVARNRALDIARGEYVTGLDSDDYLEPHAYERVIAEFPDDSDMLVLETTVFGDAEEEMMRQTQEFYDLKFEGLQKIELEHMQLTDGSFWGKVIRRTLLEKFQLRFPSGYFFEDASFFFCLMSITRRAFYLKERLHFYRMRKGSTMSYAYEKTPRALDHLKIMVKVADFYRRCGLLPDKLHMLGYAFQCSCNFVERFSPAEKADEIAKLEANIGKRTGVLCKELQYWPAVQTARKNIQSSWNRLIHKIYTNRDCYGPFGLPLWTVVHTAQGNEHYCCGHRLRLNDVQGKGKRD